MCILFNAIITKSRCSLHWYLYRFSPPELSWSHKIWDKREVNVVCAKENSVTFCFLSVRQSHCQEKLLRSLLGAGQSQRSQMVEKRRRSHPRNHQQADALLEHQNHRGNFLLSGMKSLTGTVNGSQNCRFVTDLSSVLDHIVTKSWSRTHEACCYDLGPWL
jgi:hypothetical protein